MKHALPPQGNARSLANHNGGQRDTAADCGKPNNKKKKPEIAGGSESGGIRAAASASAAM